MVKTSLGSSMKSSIGKMKSNGLSKLQKFGLVLLITILLSPGLVLNIPPIDFFSNLLNQTVGTDSDDEEYSVLDNMFMTHKTSWPSAIFHACLLMGIIFMIDSIF
jgi:hypothetical protein